MAVVTGPDFESTLVIRCLAQGLQGKLDEARATHDELKTKHPHFKFEDYPEDMGMVSEKTLAAYEEAVSTLNL